jgi:hypothetical protein
MMTGSAGKHFKNAGTGILRTYTKRGRRHSGGSNGWKRYQIYWNGLGCAESKCD